MLGGKPEFDSLDASNDFIRFGRTGGYQTFCTYPLLVPVAHHTPHGAEPMLMGAELYYPFMAGLLLGGSLIVAIGAQNAFILRQGLLRQHVFILSLICAVSDALLIAAGVAGLGTLVARTPVLIAAVTAGGAAFLFIYAFLAFRRSLHPDALHAARGGTTSLRAAVGACLAFTFLNPHVYLDTVLLVGSLSGAYHGAARTSFALGAVSASFIWFFCLGYGARLLQPVFARPTSWRVLDTVIGLIMAALGLNLLVRLI